MCVVLVDGVVFGACKKTRKKKRRGMQTSGLDEALAQVGSEEGKGEVEEELFEDTGDNVGIDLGQVWLLAFEREKGRVVVRTSFALSQSTRKKETRERMTERRRMTYPSRRLGKWPGLPSDCPRS